MSTERIKLLIPRARLRYHDLFKARAQEEGRDPTYSACFLFSPEAQATPEYAALKAGVQQVALANFGAEPFKDEEWVKDFKNPLRRAEAKKKKMVDGKPVPVAGFDPGWTFLSASSKKDFKPGVAHIVNGDMQAVIDENTVYTGCWVVATVTPFAFDTKGNYGVSFGLNNVLKVGDGERFAAGVSAPQEDFAAYLKANPQAAAAPAEDIFGGLT